MSLDGCHGGAQNEARAVLKQRTNIANTAWSSEWAVSKEQGQDDDVGGASVSVIGVGDWCRCRAYVSYNRAGAGAGQEQEREQGPGPGLGGGCLCDPCRERTVCTFDQLDWNLAQSCAKNEALMP